MEVKREVGSPDRIFSHLRDHILDLTLFLKEKNPYYFHHYFMVTKLEELWESQNSGLCPQEGEWPETPFNSTVKLPCRGAFQLGYRERSCIEQNHRVFWNSTIIDHCSGTLLEQYFIVRIVFQSASRGRSYEKQEFLEEIADRMNCDDILRMKKMAFEHRSDFSEVFKHCKLVDEALDVRFMSIEPITLEWIQFFASFARIRRIEVITEGLESRSQFELEFSREAKKECDPKRFLFCNRRDVIKGLYCSYRMIAMQASPL